MKLIKEAMLTSKLGANASKAAEVKRALGVTQLDESIVNAVNKLNESGPTGEYALSPEQIVDQVCQLAQNAGVNCSYMSGKQFTQFAREFRIELEDHYDEVYSNGEWKQLVSGAWQHYVMNKDQGVQDVANQENEEDSYRRGNDRDLADAVARQRAMKRSQEDDMWATRHIKDPLKRAEALSHFEDEESPNHHSEGFRAGYKRGGANPHQPGTPAHKEWQDGYEMGQEQREYDFREEDEEQGWPSDESSEDDFRSAEAEMMNDPSFRDEYNAPWGDEDDVGLGDDELEAPWPGDEDTRGRFQEENEEHGMSLRDFLGRSDIAGERRSMPQADRDPASTAREQKVRDAMKTPGNVNLSQEQQGWYDAQQGGTPKYPTDTEYMKGWDRYQAVNKPWAKGGVENEEQDGDKKGSMLKSLLTQRKEVSQKASEISKKYEAEGAKAFHEIRMKHEKSPYCPTKQCDEHNSWTKGWLKAAMQHYNPEPEDTKKPAKKKPAKKK